ncbi:MAG: hypothetical protein KAX78_08410, partial [Phycisphaerae bacterium]|nr:hypothetical protein [Phycisphaerae bacterium]
TASSFRLGSQTGNFYAQGTSIVTSLSFTNNIPDGITLTAGSLSFQLGSYISASASSIVFNPTAANDEEFLDVNGELTGSLNLDSLFSGSTGLSMSGSVGRFAVMGDGTFVPDAGFNVSFSVNASNLDDLLPGANFPSYLPIAKDLGGSIQISWPDFNTDPSRFLILLSLSAGGSIGPVTISGSITNLAIDTAKIAEGKFPIIDIESFSISASADPIFGGTLSGSLLMGTVKFNDQGERLPASTGITNPDAIAETVIYVGITGEFTIANRGGFKLMFGLSELGPLMAYVKADVPILLEPNSGLTLSGFRGGITFNASAFPNITDPVDLRSPMFKPARSLTDAEWLTSLQQLVVNQMGGNPGYLFTIDPADHSASSSAWVTSLDLGSLPIPFRDELLARGYALSSKTGVVQITALDAGDVWLINDRGSEFLIEKGSTGTFSVYSIGFSLDGAFVPDLGSASTATDVSGLVDAFAVAGVTLSPAATVSVLTAGEEWEIDDGGTVFALKKKGDSVSGVERIIVTGGNGSFASMDQVIKIEAGCTIYSQYAADFMQILADIIVTTDGNILISGDAEFFSGQLVVNAKIYMNLADLDAGTGKIFFLSDMPADTRIFSMHGFLSFGFLDDDDGDGVGTLITDPADLGEADAFQLELAGSPTQGVALFDAMGFQKLRLGGQADPGSGLDQYGEATLTFTEQDIRLQFNANLSAEGLISAGSFVSAAGDFTLDFSTDFDMWGVARLTISTADIYPLTVAGISGNVDATLKLNISDDPHDVTLELPGQSPVDYHLEAYSFGVYLYGDLTFDLGP